LLIPIPSRGGVIPLYNPRIPSCFTVWIKQSKGPYSEKVNTLNVLLVSLLFKLFCYILLIFFSYNLPMFHLNYLLYKRGKKNLESSMNSLSLQANFDGLLIDEKKGKQIDRDRSIRSRSNGIDCFLTSKGCPAATFAIP